jgi:transcriptional regulator with XRE-family HTH domain
MESSPAEHHDVDGAALEAAFLVRLGAAVRRRRLAMGVSQEAFAERSGHHRNFIGGLERGEYNVGISGLFRIARALGCTMTELIGEAETEQGTAA